MPRRRPLSEPTINLSHPSGSFDKKPHAIHQKDRVLSKCSCAAIDPITSDTLQLLVQMLTVSPTNKNGVGKEATKTASIVLVIVSDIPNYA